MERDAGPSPQPAAGPRGHRSGRAEPASRGLRADALRNREAIVAAARAVFAEHGIAAPLDEIARRAGVGNATLYRRFATRDELVEAALSGAMVEYVAAAEDAAAEPDAWVGFCEYLLRLHLLQARDQALADVMVTTVRTRSGELERLRGRALELTRVVIARAQRAGALRADFRHQDVPLLLMANAGVVRRTHRGAPEAWRRVASFVLDGLQAGAATPAPPPPSERAVLRSMVDRAAAGTDHPDIDPTGLTDSTDVTGRGALRG